MRPSRLEDVSTEGRPPELPGANSTCPSPAARHALRKGGDEPAGGGVCARSTCACGCNDRVDGSVPLIPNPSTIMSLTPCLAQAHLNTSRRSLYFRSIEDLLKRIQLLQAYNKYVGLFASPVIEYSTADKGKEIPPRDSLARQRPHPYLRLMMMETMTTEEEV